MLELLKNAVEAQTQKPENQRRYQALPGIIRNPRKPITEKVCRDLGDAIFAFFAPVDSVILTTNPGDHAPLAGALGKTVETP